MMSQSPAFAPVKRAGKLALFWLLAIAVSWFSITQFRQSGDVAIIWALDAIALGFVVRWPRDLKEQAIALFGYWIALSLGGLLAGSAWLVATAFPIANTVGVAVAAAWLHSVKDDFTSPKALAAFLTGAVLAAPAASGAIAALLGFFLWPHQKIVPLLVSWTFAVSLGMALVGPLVLPFKLRSAKLSGRREIATAIGAYLLIAAVAAGIFLQPKYPPLFLVYPPLVLAALADRSRGGVVAILISAIFLAYGTMTGVGPSAAARIAGADPVVVSQLLLITMAFTVLPITALLGKLDIYAAELEIRRKEAEALSQTRSKLLAHVSHEIRSPLAGVTTLAQMLKDGQFGELTPTQQETLAQIASSGAEVDALAGDLIDTAALQLGRASVNIVGVEAGPAVRSAVTAVQVRAAEYGATILVEENLPEGMMVAADPLRLRQILVNLLVNGAKYGGQPPVIRVVVSVADRVVRFEVSDNGKGLSPEKRAALFSDFNRLGAEKTQIAGTGLGLALSREIATLQNGVLSVEAGELGGLCFWLELPVWQDTASARRKPKLVAAAE